MIFRGANTAAALAAIASFVAAAPTPDAPATLVVGPFSRARPGDPFPPGWEPLTFAKISRHTTYALVADPARGTVVEARADASASGLVRRVDVDPREGARLAWSWKAERTLDRGDVTRKDGDDYPVRVYVTFRYPPDRLSAVERMKQAAARAIFGDDLPDAGINYIWDSRAPAGTIVANPYTDRVKMIVVESGTGRVGRWLDYERDIAADWRAAFGSEPPPIAGIAIMTDTDNTGESARSWYGDVVLRRATPAAAK